MWLKNSVDPDQPALDLHCFQNGYRILEVVYLLGRMRYLNIKSLFLPHRIPEEGRKAQ